MRTIGERAELLYEYKLRLTKVIEFGASLRDIVSGAARPPACGLRVDLAFEGQAWGRLAGSIEGVDYLYIRADGRMELDIRAVVMTPDATKIALAAGGVVLPRPGSTVSDLREHVKLSTANPAWAWVNPLEIWATGESDFATSEANLRGYVSW
jgi:hypothetical protein